MCYFKKDWMPLSAIFLCHILMPCYPWQAASLTHILTSLDGSISQTAEQPVTSADEAPAHVPQGHFQPWSWAYLPEKVGFLYVRHGSGECHRSVKIRAIPSDHFTEPWKIDENCQFTNDL